MGRLFWKYFLAFVLTQLITAFAVGIALHWQTLANPKSVFNISSQISAALKQLLAHALNNPTMHIAIVLCMVLIATLSFCMALRLSRPIQHLSNAIQLATKGDLSVLVASERQTHRNGLDVLGQSFADLMERLQQLISGQKRMLHHVSHELRSPLARLQMATGLAMQNHQKVETALQRIELEAMRMDNMITGLLEVSRLESGMLKLSKTAVDIGELLNTIVTDAKFEQTGIAITFNSIVNGHTFSPVYLQGQFDLLYRAIENVVRNAVKYCPENASVQIDLLVSEKTKEMVIEVQDTGFGVAESELETIFLPFVRAKSGSHKEGHGVGLAITKHIVEAHGGYVTAVNLNPKGFMVRLHFPL